MGVLWSDLILLGMGMFPSRKGNINTKKDSPYIFVANHVSMIDVMLLVSTVRKNPLVFIGKKIKPKPKNLIELNFEYGNDYKKRIVQIKGLNL